MKLNGNRKDAIDLDKYDTLEEQLASYQNGVTNCSCNK